MRPTAPVATVIDVQVDDEGWVRALPAAEQLALEAATAAAGGDGELAIRLTGDGEMRALNARYRGQDRPTNVLAFPDGGGARLGDIALALGVCRREASDQGKALADHLRHLVVHGVLHLRGYDHQSDAEAARMEDEERRLLAKMNIADPYDERTG